MALRPVPSLLIVLVLLAGMVAAPNGDAQPAMHWRQATSAGPPWGTESAVDPGSGCAIALGVARAMPPLWRRRRPARTVALILFDGEEQGLVGSFYAARHYRQGAPYRVVALYNEEQNGVGY